MLVLEDLADLQSIPQVDAANEIQSKTAVRAAAKMHGLYWNDVGGPALSTFLDYTRQFRRWAQLGYLFNLVPTLHRFGSLLSPEMRHLAETYGPRVADHLADLSAGPKTLTHGDFRLDNMFFGPNDADDFVAVDWQNCSIHSGLRDIAYFLSTSVTTELRRSVERSILEEYHGALRDADVNDLQFDDCWRTYRQVMLSCLIGPVITCGSLDLDDQDSRSMIEIGLSRTLSAIEDLDAGEFLPGRRRIFSVAPVVSAISAGVYRVRRTISQACARRTLRCRLARDLNLVGEIADTHEWRDQLAAI